MLLHIQLLKNSHNNHHELDLTILDMFPPSSVKGELAYKVFKVPSNTKIVLHPKVLKSFYKKSELPKKIGDGHLY